LMQDTRCTSHIFDRLFCDHSFSLLPSMEVQGITRSVLVSPDIKISRFVSLFLSPCGVCLRQVVRHAPFVNCNMLV
jgi:hypothetical protein